ncbi:sensor histidine kinase [Phytohabitans flavus]|uniref:histidine kinase n=1 Tax=Phytohabitans flavus TaxID=1076124 RepID=A0A6F8XU36_9ACTN|nr:histidine kinase [Phytohabitans flavus]BCB77372.1 two-component sensor histidine kinase [Phytohabitans flavus]
MTEDCPYRGMVHRLNLWLRGHPWVGDAVFVVLLGGIRAFQTGHGWGPAWEQALVLGGLVLPLMWRRHHPLPASAVVLASAAALYVLEPWAHQLPVAVFALDIMVYTLVVQGRRRPAAVVGLLTMAFFVTCTISWFRPVDWVPSNAGYLLMVALAWAVAEFMRARRAYDAEKERRAVAEERNRIARELHDVLAHSVSVMVVNAEGAALMRHSDPAVVDRTLQTISATGRAALGELRRLVDVLQDGSPRTPQPTAADLRDLTERVGAELAVTGDAEGLPASAALQAYRIVQEALTNVVKHAPAGAAAHVAVDFGVTGPGRRVRIEVTNSGGSVRAATLPASGHGLTGMRERVALFDGTLDAGPTRDGGFRVAATLQVNAA